MPYVMTLFYFFTNTILRYFFYFLKQFYLKIVLIFA